MCWLPPGGQLPHVVLLPEPSGASTHRVHLGGNPVTPRARHFDAETRGKKQEMRVDTGRKRWGPLSLEDRCPVQGPSCAHAHACVCLDVCTPESALPPTGIEVTAVACVTPHLQLASPTQRVAGDLG